MADELQGQEWLVSTTDTTTFSGEHQTTALLKLTSESDNNAQCKPHVLSSAVGTFSAVAIDQQLTLLFNQDVCCAHFGSFIDDFALLEGGFAAVAERNGTISIGAVSYGQFTVKKSYRICSGSEGGHTFSRLLFQAETDSDGSQKARVIAVSPDSLVMSSNIGLENGGIIDVSNIKVQRLAVAHLGQVVDVAATGDMIVGVGDITWVASIVEGELGMEEVLSVEEDAVIKMTRVHTLLDLPFFITMDATGCFYLWDCLTLTVVYTWKIPGALDFRPVIDQEECFSLESTRVLIMKDSEVQTITLASLEPRFTCGLSCDQARLTRCPVTQDDILLTECQTAEDFGEVETTVALRCFAEASPQKRLMRLLSRRRFEEAEELAKLYGLSYDLDPIIIQSIMREAKETYLETLEHLDTCRIKLQKNKSGDPNIGIALAELTEVQHKLKTYKLIFGDKNFSSEEWNLFQSESGLRLCSMLMGRDPEKAFTLWECLKDELSKQISSGVLGKLLISLPEDFPGARVGEWICQQAAPLVSSLDEWAVASTLDWVNAQLVAMEHADQSSWLDSAISLTSSLLASFESTCHCTVKDLELLGEEVVKTKLSNQRPLQRLRVLVQQLEEMKELRSKFKFILSLHRFKQESRESLVFRMLSRVPAADLLPSALRNTVLPYIRSRKLVADEIFAKYVEHLVQGQDMSRQKRSSCEEMVKAIIDNIASAKEKVAATLNLVQHISFPLPVFVSSLVEDILTNMKHPLCKSLKEQWAIKEAVDIMRKHYINSADVRTGLQVLDVARYLLSVGEPFSQAQKILAAYSETHRDAELRVFACRLKVERNQLDELVELINSLPKKSAVKCCQFVMFTAKHMSVEGDQVKLAEAMGPVQMLYFEAALKVSPILMSLTNDYFEQVEVMEQVRLITQIKNLQLHYNLAVSAATLSDKAKSAALFLKVCRQYKDLNLLRLGQLLNLSSSELVCCLLSSFADLTAERECLAAEKLIRLMNQAFTGVSLPIESVQDVLDQLQQPCGDQHQMLDVCFKLAGVLATYCEPEQCIKNIELSKLATITREASRLTQIHKLSESASVTEACAWDPDFLVETSSLDTSSSHAATPDSLLTSLVDLGSYRLEGAGDSNEGEEEAELETLTVMKDLVSQGHNHLALRLFFFLRQSLSCNPTTSSEDCQLFLKSTAPDRKLTSCLVEKLLKAPEGSQRMALAFALSLPQQESVALIKTILKSCGSNFKRLKKASAVASAYAEVIGNEALIKSCSPVKTIAKWGTRLAKIGIPFKVTDKLEALKKLVESPYCSVDVVREYFKDFELQGVCLMSHLALYLQHHLARDPDLSPSTQRHAREILRAMSDPLPLLRKLLQKASPYNYEKLRFLLGEIQVWEDSQDVQQGLQLLRYLDKYTRRCPPCDEEKRQLGGSAVTDAEAMAVDVASANSFADNDMVTLNLSPEASQQRLPYHMLTSNDMMAVVKPEVAMETLDAWLDMAPVLKISKDKILLRAVINIMESYISSQTSSTSSIASSPLLPSSSSAGVSPEFLTLMTNIKQVMSQFERRDHVVWCCNSMVEKLQNVEEKKLALQDCINYTQVWLDTTSEVEEKSKVQKALDMFRRRLLLLSTNAALVRAGLWDALGGKARQKSTEDLVLAVYNLAWSLLEKADVNSVVDTIGDLHEVDLTQLRLSLIQEWLLGSAADMTVDLEQTMTFDVTVCTSQTDDGEVVSRVLMLLESRDRDACLERVEQIAEDSCEDTKNRSRASFCLLRAKTSGQFSGGRL